MSNSVKILCRTAVLLALCIASQFLKNLSVYLTGSIINAILVIATLSCGFWSGIAISLVTPVTSWLITGSPLVSALPVMMPLISMSNAVLVVFTALARKKEKFWVLPLSLGVGSLAKGGFLWLTVVQWVLPILGPGSGLPEKALLAAKTTFSLTQVITALIGSALALTVWHLAGKHLKAQ